MEDCVREIIKTATRCVHRVTLLTISQDYKDERKRLRAIVNDLKDVKLRPDTREALETFLNIN